jgi:hypothetical protein
LISVFLFIKGIDCSCLVSLWGRRHDEMISRSAICMRISSYSKDIRFGLFFKESVKRSPRKTWKKMLAFENIRCAYQSAYLSCRFFCLYTKMVRILLLILAICIFIPSLRGKPEEPAPDKPAEPVPAPAKDPPPGSPQEVPKIPLEDPKPEPPKSPAEDPPEEPGPEKPDPEKPVDPPKSPEDPPAVPIPPQPKLKCFECKACDIPDYTKHLKDCNPTLCKTLTLLLPLYLTFFLAPFPYSTACLFLSIHTPRRDCESTLWQRLWERHGLHSEL